MECLQDTVFITGLQTRNQVLSCRGRRGDGVVEIHGRFVQKDRSQVYASVVPLCVAESKFRPAGEPDGVLRQMLPQQARCHASK